MIRLIASSAAIFLAFAVHAAHAKGPAYTDPAKTDADFPFQGEYIAIVSIDNSQARKGLQVVAMGGGKFHVITYAGGLPGDGWNKAERHEADAELKDGTLFISGELSLSKTMDDKSVLKRKDGAEIAKLTKVTRTSPTLGAKPPAGAVVLFDGKSADAFQNGKMTDDGLLISGCTSKQKFGSSRVHIEFRLPYMPEDRGQARGNSGIYLQGRYEVQMLDSFGLEGKNNECGGLYELKDPDVNMCLPPLVWQTYDIDYTAAKYAGDKVISPPRITVEHNGVVIHKDVELPTDRGTRAAPVKPGPEPGPIYLQDHGDPVRYRNVWLVEK
jgi:3-keto-disaccharide hydrolase